MKNIEALVPINTTLRSFRFVEFTICYSFSINSTFGEGGGYCALIGDDAGTFMTAGGFHLPVRTSDFGA
jgi:hypothetical protein